MYAPPTQYIPQIAVDRRPLVMWSIVALGSLAMMALIIVAPLALNAGYPFLGQKLYRAFSYVCHQIPERSFFLAEHQFAVCSRCTGLYAGFTIAAVIYPLVRSLRRIDAPARKWLFIGAAPLALDFALGFLGIWNNAHFSRFATGALLGAVAVFYVMPGLLDLSLRNWRASRKDSARTRTVLPAKIISTTASAPSDYSAPNRRI